MALNRPAEIRQARGWPALLRPLLQHSPERIIQCFFRLIEVAKQAYQRCKHIPEFAAIKLISILLRNLALTIRSNRLPL